MHKHTSSIWVHLSLSLYMIRMYISKHTQTDGNADGGNPFTDLNLCSSVSVNTCSGSGGGGGSSREQHSIPALWYSPDSPRARPSLSRPNSFYLLRVPMYVYIYTHTQTSPTASPSLALNPSHFSSPPRSLALVLCIILYYTPFLSTDYNSTATLVYMVRRERERERYTHAI